MELHIKIVGFLLLIVGLIHLVFPARFQWKKELAQLTLINRQLMYVHTFFIALMIFLMGLLCLTSSKELEHTQLGRNVAAGLAVFWLLRLGFQFFVYSSELWKGKKFETMVHLFFSLLWVYFTIVFFIVGVYIRV